MVKLVVLVIEAVAFGILQLVTLGGATAWERERVREAWEDFNR